ncbi:MAG TPA: hypothetical protein DDZ99_07890 [Clostridiales bacterium]|nr:hypothetical protein [Clostridiales bacterium]
MSTFKLYGDGINDDYPAIQELLDSGASLVYLPMPEVCYSISKTLRIHSNQEFRLDRFTVIKLMDDSNCLMMTNANPEEWDSNICVSGGIWDMNHNKQWQNPYHFPNPITGLTSPQVRELAKYDPTKRLFLDTYCGHCFRFNSIRNFIFRNLTIRNPVVYGAQFAFIKQFTVEDIIFDYTEGSPKLWNLDGVHFEGGCKKGVIRNLKGTCHDDLVAITSDDDVHGPVENITVDGIYSDNCHSAVRMLSVKTPIKNIHISNIYGTFYVYCIIFSKYWGTAEDRGCFENIVIDNVYASLCKGTVDVPGNYEPLIAIKNDLIFNNLVISNLYRDETVCATPTIGIGENTYINELSINHSQQRNFTDKPITYLQNNGKIDNLNLCRIDSGSDELIAGNGEVILKNEGRQEV